MKKDKKVLIILIPGFPKDEGDSTCLPFPQSFVKNMKRLNPGIEILVLTFQYPFFRGRYRWNGIEVESFNGRNKGKLNRIFLWYIIWRRLNRILKERNVFGILSFWMGECALIGKYAAKKFGKPLYIWLQGQEARMGNKYYSFIKPNPESLISLSDFLSDEMFKNYKMRPANTIPPGIDPAEFSQPNGLRPIDIIGAGSLIPLKQYEQFIRIIAKLVVTRPQLKAVICGDGPEHLKLQELIEQYNLNSQVELRGELQHVQLLELMASSKIFLHPSSYEGFGVVISEALYSGAHVVSYKNPMQMSFEHLHVVNSMLAMTKKVEVLLDDKYLDHKSVLASLIDETCINILNLYEEVSMAVSSFAMV